MHRARHLPAQGLAAALAAIPAWACDPGPDGFGIRPGDDTGESAGVVIEQRLGEASPCEPTEGCWEDYASLYERIPDCVHERSRAEVEALLRAIEDEEVLVFETEVAPERLAASVQEAARLGCLVAGMEERALTVSVLDSTTADGTLTWKLLFDDPLVGRFTATYLEPEEDHPLPAVVAIHGHFSSSTNYLDEYRGADLAAAGMAVLALDMRANLANATESELTWDLLEHGLSFAGIRVYETLLARRFLEATGSVDPERIGLIGHSGGAVVNNLTLRLDQGFAAVVTDWVGKYHNLNFDCTTDDYACLVDETTPSLYPLHARINDLDTAPVPVLLLEYAATTNEEGSQEAIGFFEDWL